MARRNVAEYFVVVGLDETSQRFDASSEIENESAPESVDEGPEQMDLPAPAEPITHVSIIFAGAGERLPAGYECITSTAAKFPANFHHGSTSTAKAVYICYKRGRDGAPLTDIDIAYGSPQLVDFDVVSESVLLKRSADINHSPTSPATYIAYRRAKHTGAGSGYHFYGMALTDLCLINSSKNEAVPRGFTMINKAIHCGLTGPTFYLCYKKTLVKPHAVAYRAATLSRFPLADKEDFPLPAAVPLFCLPLGASVESWSDGVAYPIPTFSSFVLTGAMGEKVYGAAVVFYEELPQSKQTPLMRQALFGAEMDKSSQLVYSNKAICVLSRWPFFQAFKTYLSSLYRISISGPSPIPLERYISNFVLDVPFPSSSRPRVLIQLGPESVLLSQPMKTSLPLCGATHSILLRCLDTGNLMTLLALMLHEQQIILHSVRPSLLTSFGEAICSILFPFSWQCPYIPLCPLALASFIHAPMPFLVGIDSRFFDLYDPPEDCVCVNLDNNTIAHSVSSGSMTWQTLPKKPAQQLNRTLKQLQAQVPLSTDLDSDLAVTVVPPPSSVTHAPKADSASLNLAVREAFLRFHAQILAGYSKFLRPLTKAPSQTSTDVSQIFDLKGFLKSKAPQDHPFFTKIYQTQVFSHLIEHRSFMTSAESGSLAFFDECVANVEKPEPLVTVKEGSTSTMTVVVSPPDLSCLDEKEYVYETFALDDRLFTALPPAGETRTVADVSPPASVSGSSTTNPVFQRTAAEREKSLQTATRNSESPTAWANYLYAHVYALWFIHLPAFAHLHPFKREALSMAFKTLEKMDEQRLRLPDEVSYRVLMDLCAKLGHPVLAVRVFMEMRRIGVTPNAVTYAHYNKAMLECDWPSKTHMWRTLRNVLRAICCLRTLLREKRDGEAALNALSSADPASREMARRKMKKSTFSSNTVVSPSSSAISLPASARAGSRASVPLLHSSFQDEVRVTVATTEEEEEEEHGMTLTRATVRPPSPQLVRPGLTSHNGYSVALGGSKSLRSEQRSNSCTCDDISIAATSISASVPSPNSFKHHRRRSSVTLGSDQESADSFLLSPGRANSTILSDVFSPLTSLSATPSLENVMTRACGDADSLTTSTATTRDTGTPVAGPSRSDGFAARLHISPLKSRKDSLVSRQSAMSSLSSGLRYASKLFHTSASKLSAPRVAHIELGTEVTAGVRISSSVRCHHCRCVLYDEQIMSRWKADDSNLNTSCCYCGNSLVAFLRISSESYDQRVASSSGLTVADGSVSPPGLSIEAFIDDDSSAGQPSTVSDPVLAEKNTLPELSVPFLSPLLLRKEVETLLVNDGIEALVTPSFVDQHPVIYWNLLYFFVRLNLPTKLATLFSSSSLAQAQHVSPGSVSVQPVWHMAVSSDTALPFYQRWLSRGMQQNVVQNVDRDELSSQLQSLAARLQCGDYHAPMAAMLKERLTVRRSNSAQSHTGRCDPSQFRSIYWELLCFLAVVRGSNLDIGKFDRDFSRAISRLSRDLAVELRNDDHAPDVAALAFRNRFGQLCM